MSIIAAPGPNGAAGKRGRGRALLAAVSVILALAGCAGDGTPRPGARTPAQAEQEAIAAVLRTGFTEIRDKGLVENTIADLFLAGLAEIKQLDPALRFTAADGRLMLRYGELPPADVARPADGDLAGWIGATTTLFAYAQETSPLAKLADRERLYQFMFEGALSKVDAYSRYSGRSNARANRAARNGFVGIGIDYEMVPGGAIIRSVVADGPAARAGLKSDDLISAADNKSLVGLTRDGARRLIAGPPDSVVRLTVFRAGEDRALNLAIRRSLIVPRTVEATLIDGIAFLKVRSFNIRTASDVSQAVAEAKASNGGGIDGVVLDLRGDPGGLLDQAVDLSDLFLEGGTITTLTGRHPGAKQYYAAKPGDIADGKPIVVLVDGKSASAAEIAAAALADNGRALVIGTNTLGKGSVQTLIRLPNDGEIALTWAEVVSPGGYKVHGLGLLPTICTSGSDGPLAEIMEAIYRREAPWRARPVAWRAGAPDDAAAAYLRGMCPAQSRPDQYIDQALAVRVALDRALYAQASSANLAASR